MRPLFRAAPLGVALALSLLAAGCNGDTGLVLKGSGTSKVQPRRVTYFKRIRAEGPARVVVTVGGAVSVEIEGDDNLVDRVVAMTYGGELKISTEGVIKPRLDLIVRISVPELESVVLSGSGGADVTGLRGGRAGITLEGSGNAEVHGAQVEELAVAVLGSGDMELADVQSGRMVVTIKGSGAVEAAGRVDELDVIVEGSGDAALGDLAATQVLVKVSGSGDATVNAIESLTARVTGSGNVAYVSEPKRLEREVTGSGTVAPR